MNITLDLSSIGSSISRFLHRFHVVIFVLVVIGGLSVATFFLSSAMNPSSNASSTTTETTNATPDTTTLDAATMKKVKALRTDSAPLVLPTGRTNPFN